MSWALLALLLADAEVLARVDHRAVTLAPGERRRFRVPDLETVTGSTGRCVEEGMDGAELETLYVEASCPGVRTSIAWTRKGRRVHIMACAEDEQRPKHLLGLRKALQAELKGLASVTACVRNRRVELWGWVDNPLALARMAELERKHGLELVRSFVELLEPERP